MRSLRLSHALFVSLAVAVAALALSPVVRNAEAGPVVQARYLGPHPIPAEYGGGYCEIEYPHFHNYGPARGEPYREHRGGYAFVGDPAAEAGYDGPKYGYYGPHPLPTTVIADEDGAPEYCYIKGPHYHAFRPIVDDGFTVKDDVYWYTGSYSPAYYAARPEYEPVENAYYSPRDYQRPIAVDPPEGYEVVPPPPPAGVFIDAPVAEVTVAPPLVGLELPIAPTVTVAAVGPAYVAPPVVVTHPVGGVWLRQRGVYAPPAAGVIYTPPMAGVEVDPSGLHGFVQPPSIGISVGLPSAAIIVGGGGMVVPAAVPMRPHDEGEHEGFFRGEGDRGDQGDHGDRGDHGHDRGDQGDHGGRGHDHGW